MRWSGLLLLLLAPLAGSADAEIPEALVIESREAADMLSSRLRELSRSLSSSGPLRGIAVRKYTMPEISSAISRKTGAKVGMVSLEPRNPALATPDAWEREVLLQFVERARRGEKTERLEHYQLVTEGDARFFRYMKPIMLTQECLACHGEKIAPDVRAQLANDYPHDRSTGYKPGDVRGAVSVKRPL